MRGLTKEEIYNAPSWSVWFYVSNTYGVGYIDVNKRAVLWYSRDLMYVLSNKDPAHTQPRPIPRKDGDLKLNLWKCIKQHEPPIDDYIVVLDDGVIYWDATQYKGGEFQCAQGHILNPTKWMTIKNATELLLVGIHE